MVTTGSAQPDIVVPGHATIDTWVPDSGLPMSELWVEVGLDDGAIPMPPGPSGIQGIPGSPRATFVKMGTLVNAAARPAILGADARGWWWHRLDTNGMDVWTGTEWKHSPDAVGGQGAPARNNVLTAKPVLRDERATIAALEVKGTRAIDQTLQYTTPAGERGERGPDAPVFGQNISDAPDYDNTTGPVNGSMFSYSRKTRRFRPVSRPGIGYGPYHFGSEIFSGQESIDNGVGSGEYNTGRRTVATVTIPAMPYAWRPFVWGMLQVAQVPQGSILFGFKTGNLRTVVRVNSETDGDQVAMFSNPYTTDEWNDSYWVTIDAPISPFFGSTQQGRIRKNTYGVVPAYKPCTLYVRLEMEERGFYSWAKGGAYLDVWAVPIEGDLNGSGIVVDYSMTDGGYSEWQL